MTVIAKRLGILIGCVLVCATARDAAGQTCPTNPYYVEHPGDENTTPFVSRNGNQCEAGAYVRRAVPYTVHFLTQVSGSCDIYFSDYLPPACIFGSTQNRGVGWSGVYEAGVSGTTSVYPNPNNFPQTLDTRQSGTSAPDNPTYSFSVEGANRTLTVESSIYATNCDFQPESVTTQIAFTVVNCVPQWLKTEQGALRRHAPTNPIIVRVPPSMNTMMKQGISAAVAAWNAALNNYGATVGPRYEYSESSTPCVAGPNCINTQQGTVPGYPNDCALATIGADPGTGLITNSTVLFPTQSSGYNINFATRLAAHELAHHLGLANNTSTCQTINSLMKPVTCGASSGFPTAPTVSDHLAVARSYQGETTAVCQ